MTWAQYRAAHANIDRMFRVRRIDEITRDRMFYELNREFDQIGTYNLNAPNMQEEDKR